MKNEKKTRILTTLVCLLPLIAGAILYKDLPETMATHWNLQGEADGWSGRVFAVFGLPGHPAAACTSAQLFVLPLLRRLAGEAGGFPDAGIHQDGRVDADVGGRLLDELLPPEVLDVLLKP